MTGSPEDEVRQIEGKIDAWLTRHELLKSPLYSCLWYLLTVHEDYLRIPAYQGSLPKGNGFGLIDHAKYGLKYAFDAAHKGASNTRPFRRPEHINWGRYRLASDLFRHAMDYQFVVSAYTLYSRGLAKAEVIDRNTVRFSRDPSELKYDVLGIILAQARGRIGRSSVIEPPAVAERVQKAVGPVLATVRHSGKEGIEYECGDADLVSVADALGSLAEATWLLPGNWSFRGISIRALREIWSLLNGLSAIHFLAHGRGAATGVEALAARTIVLLTPPSEVEAKLTRVAHIAHRDEIREILRLQVYDPELPSPKRDPALQPLVALGSALIAVAPQLIIGSNEERNFVAFLARHFKREYDETTHVFESALIQELREKLGRTHYRVASQVRVPGRAGLPDIDLVIGEDNTGILQIIELKWVIEPSETWELLERAEAQRKGIDQVRRLLSFERENPGRLWAICFPGAPKPSQVSVRGCVAMRGFWGTAAAEEGEVPVVEENLLVGRLASSGPLDKVWEWLNSRQFLPQEGVHFDRRETEARFGECVVLWEGFVFKNAAEQRFLSDALAS